MKRILLVTTLPSEVSHVRIPPGDELLFFDFSINPYGKKEFIYWLENYINSANIDILVTYRCPYIIPPRIIDALSESINIHPLKLPHFGGLNPWEKFKASGMDSSEAVLHRLDYTADTGEIIMREPFSFTSFSEARRNSDYAACRLLEKYFNLIVD